MAMAGCFVSASVSCFKGKARERAITSMILQLSLSELIRFASLRLKGQPPGIHEPT